MHALWSCSGIQHKWLRVHNYIQGVLECCFPFSPCIYVLGDPSFLSPEVETAEI